MRLDRLTTFNAIFFIAFFLVFVSNIGCFSVAKAYADETMKLGEGSTDIDENFYQSLRQDITGSVQAVDAKDGAADAKQRPLMMDTAGKSGMAGNMLTTTAGAGRAPGDTGGLGPSGFTSVGACYAGGPPPPPAQVEPPAQVAQVAAAYDSFTVVEATPDEKK